MEKKLAVIKSILYDFDKIFYFEELLKFESELNYIRFTVRDKIQEKKE